MQDCTLYETWICNSELCGSWGPAALECLLASTGHALPGLGVRVKPHDDENELYNVFNTLCAG